MPEVTPDDLQDLVDRAAALAADVDAIRDTGRSDGDAEIRRVFYRLDDTAGRLRTAAADLLATASDLARQQSRPTDACPAEWGVCPDHGATLSSSGGRSRCVTAGCGRTWDYNRENQRCTEPVAFEVQGVGDGPDHWGRLCAGHTVSARGQIYGVQVRPV